MCFEQSLFVVFNFSVTMESERPSGKRRRERSSSDDSASPGRRRSRSSRHRSTRSREAGREKRTRHRQRSRSPSRRRDLDERLRQQEGESLACPPVENQPLLAALPSGQPPVASNSNNDFMNFAMQFKELIQTMKTASSSSNERFPTINVIPEFDPAKRTQTVDMWILKVNECAKIYDWTERQIIHYALPKLVSLAQKWYQGLPSLLFSWSEWQDKLKSAFPSDENYGQLLTDMLAYKARFGEPLVEYFYEKMVLLNRCRITGKDAIDCVLLGIEDRSVRTSAEAAQFTEPDKLLVFLRSVKIIKRTDKTSASIQPSIFENKRTKYFKSVQNNNHSKSIYKCYNCGEEGHSFYKCRQPVKRCDSCHKVGHLTTDCFTKKEGTTNKVVLRVSLEQDNDIKYFKSANVNGEQLECFIDFGSQCTMLKESTARTLSNQWVFNDLPILRGFGDAVVNCIGKLNVTIKVDSAEATLEALIVPDNFLKVPILLGQTFTEQEHVVVYKTNDTLNITTKTMRKKENILLHVHDSVNIKGYTIVVVRSTPPYNGDLFIEPSLCQQSKREYEVIQSVINIKDGFGQIVVKGLAAEGFMLYKDSLLVRGMPLKESNSSVQTVDVNRIEKGLDGANNSLIDETMINVNDDIGINDKLKLIMLLNEYRDCFAFSVKELGCVNNSEMDIKLKDPTPVVYRPYRLPHSEREVVRSIVQELEESGIVQQSSSEYASPILLVKKKTGDYRLCIDFRTLNKRTVKEHYPLPRIDDQIDDLAGNKFYTTLDLASGYYQIPMSVTSRHLTAFVTPDGHFEFTRMPFGLVNAPSTFQKTINNILGNARFKDALAYMDDVNVPSKTVEDGFRKLREILDLFRAAGLTLNLKKCHFLMQSINYLGFEISEAGIRPGRNKIEAVEKFPKPTDQHKVRQFVGLASFFRRFIKGFSAIAKPLTRLLKKDARWTWGEEEENAFSLLKNELIKRPVLSFYNPAYETQLHTDASKIGVAGILLQRRDKSNPFTAVAYYSRQTSPEEAKFSSYDLETLAVVSSMQRFRVYLLGIPFTIVTDCNSLRATFEKKDMLPRVARWWSVMQEYDFNIIYKPGLTMSHVDALSRNPADVESPPTLEVRNVDSNWITTVQHSDSELQRIISILNDENSNNIADIKNNYLVKRGLLYRKTEHGDRWVVPKGVRWQVMKANHDDIGHFGLDKTFEKIKSNFWFAKMRRFTKKYVDSCLECAHAKVPAGKKAGELHPIPKVDCPFHTIHIDHLGPFVRSKKKNSYLLLIIDAFTKYIMLVPVKSTKTVHSIRAMKNYFHTFGVPKRLISDRGASFTAKRFKEYLHSLGIRHILNATASPRANGQVERYNRTVLAALTATTLGKQERLWDECVSEIQWGLNNTVNKGTGKTPAQALFGLQLIGTSDSVLQLHIDSNAIDDLDKRIDDVRSEMSEHIQLNQQRQKEVFDKGRKRLTFQVGELVRIEREIPASGQSKKLVPKLRGPYRIATVLDNDRYVVEDTPLSRKGNRAFTGIFSVDKIHSWMVYNRDNNSDSSSESD